MAWPGRRRCPHSLHPAPLLIDGDPQWWPMSGCARVQLPVECHERADVGHLTAAIVALAPVDDQVALEQHDGAHTTGSDILGQIRRRCGAHEPEPQELPDICCNAHGRG